MRLFRTFCTVVMILTALSFMQAQQKDNHKTMKQSGMMGHGTSMKEIMLDDPSQVKWMNTPPELGLPSGAQVAILEGNPHTKGLFTVRLKFPSNYRIPAHWHPTEERITVLDGSFYMGMGDKLDSSKGTEVKKDGFFVLPAHAHHFAWTSGETTVELTSPGPFAIHYINPNDDPRKATSSSGNRRGGK